MKNLSTLNLGCTAIEQLPSSIEHLVGLAKLCMFDCKSLLGLPSAICKLKSLKVLMMDGCSKVDKLPGEMECLEELNLCRCAIREPLVAMKNLKNLTLHGSVASRDGIERWGSVLSSLNHLGSLTDLDLSDCNIGEGAIPDDIGRYLSSLKKLDLRGNNFVSLPSSFRFLSELEDLQLQRCKRLEQLPDLPPRRSSLFVSVDNCTSLKRLSGPSKLGKGANVYDFMSSCVHCFRLVEEEGRIWINRIFAMISMATYLNLDLERSFVWPGNEIPEWFDNRSVGDSIIVELPLLPQTCNDWVGIALCVVFEDSNKYLKDPPYVSLKIRCMYPLFEAGHLESQHVLVFYLPRNARCFRGASSSHRFSFEGDYYLRRSHEWLETSSIIKKCGARLVYQKDLEEFS